MTFLAGLAARVQAVLASSASGRVLDGLRLPAGFTTEQDASAVVRAHVGRQRGTVAALAPSGWLVGGAYSIADIAAVPFAKRIEEEIAPDQMAREKHPLVADWWLRVQARPAFARAGIGPFTDRPVAP